MMLAGWKADPEAPTVELLQARLKEQVQMCYAKDVEIRDLAMKVKALELVVQRVKDSAEGLKSTDSVSAWMLTRALEGGL